MSEGREADITVLSLEEVDMDLEDCQSQMRRIKQRLLSAEVWRAGGVGGDRKTKPVSPDPERFFLRRMVDTTGSPRSIDSVMRSGSFSEIRTNHSSERLSFFSVFSTRNKDRLNL